jgi:Uma2 family endonuclease
MIATQRLDKNKGTRAAHARSRNGANWGGSAQLTINLRPIIDMTDDQFLLFCHINHNLRIERSATGEIIIMAPVGGESGSRNLRLAIRVGLWAEQDGSGVAFDSSTGFRLPNGAIRAPDASWVRRTRLATLTSEQKRKFLPLCPDFVAELRSPSDSLDELQQKMVEYIANGAQLGWLLDPTDRSVYVYRSETDPVRLFAIESISGDPLLPGFVLALNAIWNPGF